MTTKEKLQKLQKADIEYYYQESALDDSEYDILKDSLLEVPESDPLYSEVQSYLKRVGAPLPVSNWEKAFHSIPMCSLNKVKTYEEFLKWAPKNKELVVEEKIDGLSLSLEYSNGECIKAITRGEEGIEGEMILQNVSRMQGFYPTLKEFTGALRCEIRLQESNFKVIQQVYEKEGLKSPANSRNAASGISRRYDGRFCELLDLVYYDVTTSTSNISVTTELEKLSFINNLGVTPAHIVWYQKATIANIETIYNNYISTKRKELTYPIDGLVIKINSLAVQEELGVSGGRPKGQIALKFPPTQVVTTLESVTWQIARTGRLTPVGNLKPVLLDGSTIRNASCHNLGQIRKMNLMLGDVVIQKSGDIIPQVVRNITQTGTIIAPEVCPECNSKLVYEDPFLWCRNPVCPKQVVDKILNYAKVIGMFGIAESFIEALFERKIIQRIPDLYRVTPDQLSGIPGIGDLLIERYFKELERTKKISLEIFLQAMGMDSIGTFGSNILVETFKTLPNILKVTEKDLVSLKGLAEISAKTIVDGLKAHEELILETYKYIIVQEKGDKLEGKTFVMTEAFSKPRSIYEKAIKSLGGKVGSSVTKATTYLVTNYPDTETAKNKKAKELKIPVISEEELIKLL